MTNDYHWHDKTANRLGQALLDISNLVGSVMRLDDILGRIVAITAGLLEMPVCSIYLLNEENELILKSNVGLEPELMGRTVFQHGEGLPGWVCITGEVLAIPDVSRDPRFKPLDSFMEKDYTACLCAPLRIQEEIVGALSIRGAGPHLINRQKALLLETVSKMVAIVMEKSRLYTEMVLARELAAVAVSLSGTAHYIKNIMFTTQIAEATIDKTIAEQGDIQRIATSWQALKGANAEISKLVGNMLNYCREEPPAYETVDLHALVNHIANEVREVARKRNVEIIVESDPHMPLVELALSPIQDALLNLLTNAIDAAPAGRGGHVWLRAHRVEDQNNCHLQVADDGVGIAAANRDKIFTLFFSTKGQGGTGIGLASTRKIIERHGGTIDFASVEGKGTTFDVYLPTSPAALAPELARSRLP